MTNITQAYDNTNKSFQGFKNFSNLNEKHGFDKRNPQLIPYGEAIVKRKSHVRSVKT